MSAYRPNTTQFPDILLDRWLAVLGGSEFKVLCYCVRRTYGFGKPDGDGISLSQLVSGIQRRTRSGEECDWGTGLDKDTVVAALDVLEGIGLLTRRRTTRSDGGTDATFYTINLDAPIPERSRYKKLLMGLRSGVRQNRKTHGGSPKNPTPPVSEIPTGGLSEKSDTPCPKIPDTGVSEKSDGGMVGPLSENSDTQQTETYRVATNSNAEGREAENKLPEQTLRPSLDAVAAVSIETPEPEGETERIPDGISEDPRTALVDRLVAVGVTLEVATKLVGRYPQQCVNQLKYLPYATIRSTPAAYIVAAIKGAYAAPQSYVEAQRERQESKDLGAPPRRVSIAPPKVVVDTAAASDPEETDRRMTELRGNPERWEELFRTAEEKLHPALRRPGSTGKAYIGVVEAKMREILESNHGK